MTYKKTPTDANVAHKSAEAVARQKLPAGKPPVLDQLSQPLYELRCHQAELEIQNEELRYAQHELEISRAQYVELYDHAPLGYFTLDEYGLIERVNLTAAALLCTTRETLLNVPFTRFVMPTDHDSYYLQRRQSVTAGVNRNWDMRLLRVDGSPFWGNLTLVVTPNGGCRITVNDITTRKANEMIMAVSLKLSEYAVSHSLDELLTQVLDEAESITGSIVGFFHFLEPDQVTLKLQAWSTNTIKTMCTAEGKGRHYSVDKAGVWVDCVHSRKPVIHNSYADLPNRKGLPHGHAPIERELVVPVFREDLIVGIIGVGNKPTDYLAQDVTAVSRLINFTWDIVVSKQQKVALRQAHDDLEARVAERTADLAIANEQMKKVSFELIWAEEKERERIAGELHDQVGQSLLLAKMKLDALAEQLPTDSIRTAAEEAAALVSDSIRDIRSLTFRMRPPLLDTAGIETSLNWLCASISQDYNLQVDFADDGQPKPLSAEARYSLYQAVRELLLNVVKHAQAEKAQLAIRIDKQTLVVQVIDHGVGFSLPEERPDSSSSGYGLYNVQQRVKHLGGTIAIESTPQRGTTVTLQLPLTES